MEVDSRELKAIEDAIKDIRSLVEKAGKAETLNELESIRKEFETLALRLRNASGRIYNVYAPIFSSQRNKLNNNAAQRMLEKIAKVTSVAKEESPVEKVEKPKTKRTKKGKK